MSGLRAGNAKVGIGALPAHPHRIDVRSPSGKVEHGATTSKIGEDQLFYFQGRGIGNEEAVSMIINGFVKDVFTQLPMEFAVEATKLLGLKLEGSVG